MTSSSTADGPSAFAEKVSQAFASRPAFEQVAQQMFEHALKERYPSLCALDFSNLRVATPTDSRSWGFALLMPRLLDYLALGTPVDLGERHGRQCYLSQTFPYPLSSESEQLDIKVVENLIRELPWTVPIGLETALTDYWNGDIEANGVAAPNNVTSRWRWLSDSLKNLAHVHALQQPGLTEPQRDALDQLARWPEGDQRLSRHASPVYAYALKTTLTQGASSTVLPSNDILLQRFTRSGRVILLCSPGNAVRPFASMETFLSHWGERFANRYVADTITCQYNEIAGNAFDTQAMLILEQQLLDLKAIQLPSRIGLQNLSRLYNELSDPARYLLDAPRLTPQTSAPLQSILPDWVKQASIVDQTRFQHYSLALASAKRNSQGRTFLSDIQNIEQFAAEALLDRMRQINDSSRALVQASHYAPDDIELIFTVAAGFPGTAGIVEKRTMTLTELAIRNLVGRPSGRVRLRHRHGLTLPEWLTPDLINRPGGLIEQVDIGTAYPRYLQQKLLDNASEAPDHQRLFADQYPAQLALEALKLVHSNENGMTRQGLDLVEALLKPDASEQQVGGRPVLIRHLALLRRPEARPDTVTNMFIIESQDHTTGPHLLYRPLYSPTLHEFPTRAALLQAIATPGELQTSILNWMPDAARPIYDGGGFLEPHIVRFLQGDEFTLAEKPAPATLATDAGDDELQQSLRNGVLMQYLYGCNAEALISQADRGSNSNTESRWAVLIEGSSLLFNTLLVPLLRGPAMAATWLWNLMASASHDIPAFSSDDPMTRELAAIDLLINLSMLVNQFHTSATPFAEPLPESLKTQTMRPPAPRIVAEQWPAPAAPAIVNGAVALPGEYSEAAGGALDFSFASARHRLTPPLRARLNALRVPRPASLPAPLKEGPLKGLYLIGGQYHVLIEGILYQARQEPGGSMVMADPLDPARNGPALKTDGLGNWSMDLRLRLRGGMPKRITEMRERKIARLMELSTELKTYANEQTDRQRNLNVALAVLTRLNETSGVSEQRLSTQRGQVSRLIQEQTDIYLKLLTAAPEFDQLGLELPPGTLHSLMENLIVDSRKALLLAEMDRAALMSANSRYTGDVDAVEAAVTRDTLGYLRYLDELSRINDRAIHWLDLKDQYLEALYNLDADGMQAFQRLTQDRPPNERDSIATKAVQLPTLASLVFKRFDSDLPDSVHRILQPLVQQVRTHSDLKIYELPATQQLELLESLTQHYGEALDALQGIKALEASEINPPYFDRLIKLVEGLYEEVHKRLAAEVKPEPQRKPRPPKQTRTPAGKPQKKVIRTRKSGFLIGDLKPVGTAPQIETVELRSEVDDQVIATYTQHDDVWDMVEVRRPTPPPRTRALNAVRSDVQALLGQLDARMRGAQSYKAYCRYPQEIEEILNIEATRFSRLGEEFDRAINAAQAPRTPADQALAGQIAAAVTLLTTRGRALRIELSLQLPPTDGTVRYLFENDLIQVARLGPRQAMTGSRKDYLQEYAINDRDGRPVWYAHFHYEKADTPKADYSVAHLKTKEQRRANYHSLLAHANNPHAVVDVYRGRIGKSLAASKFLPLAP
ncbi:DUF6543 domain-containing protein [Pseudomonas sp. T1.Ur]|uniref:dermonecrotic toxin domain-containing protein n=1 Tax=Pseudomonas sp. T1.Ur TaxID=2928704 RepID=UPI00201DEAC7|nr:DUF6543 domain-containing protein [Pseudomonas sp. T1.Ur]MCL6702448.1 hypothetical protein [Pseudomonas sp. T1.Ur]